MTPELALQTLGAHALKTECPTDRLVLLEALSTLAAAANLHTWANEAAAVAEAMRTSDNLQLNFIDRLNSAAASAQ